MRCGGSPLAPCAHPPKRTLSISIVPSNSSRSQRELELAALLVNTASIIISRHKESEVRKRAEEALREGEARVRTLLKGIAQTVWETNADGVVVTDSPSWRSYKGQTLQEWLGYGWLDATHPDDREDAERQWREAVG